MTGRIILVPHPGPERRHGSKSQRICPWPKDDGKTKHARKWLETDGRYLDAPDGSPYTGTLGVWCEYEAPTLLEPCSGAAKWLHRIAAGELLAEPAPHDKLNTDPWLWMDGFAWTVCRQTRPSERRIVQSLKAGDMVIFGSEVHQRWVMDTVLMFRERLRAPPISDELYDRCVVQPLAGVGLKRPPVVGAGWSPGARMYSFAPVQVGNTKTAPPRVDITHILAQLRKSGDIPPSPINRMSLVACTHADGSEAVWDLLTAATLGAGLKLGIAFGHPCAIPA